MPDKHISNGSSNVTVASIMAKIARMGHVYQPGNASKPGHLYSPLPFPEFDGVPYQRTAVAERFFLLEHSLPRPFAADKKLLDIGCHAGYNCFRFRNLGYNCTGMEADPLTAEIAQDVADFKNTGIRFINSKASIDSLESLGHFDLVLFLSTFQWIVQMDGFDKAKDVLALVQANSDVMYFETSMGMEGKMKLPQLPNKEAVQALLLESGFHKTVDNLGPMASPGDPKAPPRYVFRCQKEAVPYACPNNALPPQMMHQMLSQLANVAPVYKKENDHFVSRVFKISVQGKPAALKIVQKKSHDAGMLLYREHEFLRCMKGIEGFPNYIGHGIHDENYLLMTEWEDGEVMQDIMLQITGSKAQMIAKKVRDLGRQLESKGIIHRDIWEKNILVNGDRIVLLDFGWSCWADEKDLAFKPKGLREADDTVAIGKLQNQLDKGSATFRS